MREVILWDVYGDEPRDRVNVGIQEVCEGSGLTQISVADEDDTLRWSG